LCDDFFVQCSSLFCRRWMRLFRKWAAPTNPSRSLVMILVTLSPPISPNHYSTHSFSA
jgi:hypothetical protein